MNEAPCGASFQGMLHVSGYFQRMSMIRGGSSMDG